MRRAETENRIGTGQNKANCNTAAQPRTTVLVAIILTLVRESVCHAARDIAIHL